MRLISHIVCFFSSSFFNVLVANHLIHVGGLWCMRTEAFTHWLRVLSHSAMTHLLSRLPLFQSSSEQPSGSTSTSRMQTGERPKAISLLLLSTSRLAVGGGAADCQSEFNRSRDWTETQQRKHVFEFYLPCKSHLLLQSGLQGSGRALAHWLLIHSQTTLTDFSATVGSSFN